MASAAWNPNQLPNSHQGAFDGGVSRRRAGVQKSPAPDTFHIRRECVLRDQPSQKQHVRDQKSGEQPRCEQGPRGGREDQAREQHHAALDVHREGEARGQAGRQRFLLPRQIDRRQDAAGSSTCPARVEWSRGAGKRSAKMPEVRPPNILHAGSTGRTRNGRPRRTMPRRSRSQRSARAIPATLRTASPPSRSREACRTTGPGTASCRGASGSRRPDGSPRRPTRCSRGTAGRAVKLPSVTPRTTTEGRCMPDYLLEHRR